MASKYVQIKNHLKELISTGSIRENQKISTENELAKEFNVSRQTIRRAIGELVKDGLLYSVQGKGTFVHKSKKPRSHIVGLISTFYGYYQIWPSIVAGIDKQLSEKGFSTIIAHSNNKIENEARCLENLLKKDIDGLIVEPSKSALPSPNIELYKEFIKKGTPLVFINGYYPDIEAPYVIEDDEHSGYLATKHLLDYGHKKVGGIFKFDDLQGHNRYKGYIKAFKEKGITVSEEMIIWFSTEDYEEMWKNNDDQDMTYSAFLYKRIKDCTAIVAYNDWVALKIINILKMHQKKIPDDLSLVSFDDTDITKMLDFGLTNIPYPATEMGEEAALILLSILYNNPQIQKKIIKSQIIIRESTRHIK